uniref:Methyltransferase domain-containing protein n=1 Tax=Chromera velia CCMP2878 TaxID=1169474 RepID=A0A0G4GB38_9ALVE|mmetsp:Transcript_8436/g.16397  ORF Transcript_8436/g.16397 Transcript_8436/m.16397 type:complete len:239 (-) Transcript_8436:418-1134(-)|eukprot:Cvel_21094.t1-p1 / transcript=Cvel_21094.t1 / gene=Cvel_21094 / organism=Chromera_velia_CCMP2878 / gene_product=hypothetical protein / transcript_product=hypothetical protein / location=Cvel_scaffold1950:22455-23168(-) / protein_length=238 / sequence_SO=supercontig / SO=protein_coding / is_pseudo=false
MSGEEDSDGIDASNPYHQAFPGQFVKPTSHLFGYEWSEGLLSPFREAAAESLDAALVVVRQLLVEADKDTAREKGKESTVIVTDLGSGNGALLLRARDVLGSACLCTGVEMDSALVKESRERAVSSGVAESVRIVQGDLLDETVWSPGIAWQGEACVEEGGCFFSVVFVYLVTEGLRKVLPLLEKLLEKGAQVISMGWEVPSFSHKLSFSGKGFYVYGSLRTQSSSISVQETEGQQTV